MFLCGYQTDDLEPVISKRYCTGQRYAYDWHTFAIRKLLHGERTPEQTRAGGTIPKPRFLVERKLFSPPDRRHFRHVGHGHLPLQYSKSKTPPQYASGHTSIEKPGADTKFTASVKKSGDVSNIYCHKQRRSLVVTHGTIFPYVVNRLSDNRCRICMFPAILNIFNNFLFAPLCAADFATPFPIIAFKSLRCACFNNVPHLLLGDQDIFRSRRRRRFLAYLDSTEEGLYPRVIRRSCQHQWLIPWPLRTKIVLEKSRQNTLSTTIVP